MADPLFPLADRLRPENLADFIGQRHLTGKNKLIAALANNKTLNSLIFWGPPGSGKTTLARILIHVCGLTAKEFSATITGIGEIKEIMEESRRQVLAGAKPLVLFVDEIHHFNRSIQDAFLPYVERGEVILLGTTTDNPAYKMNRALLSRLRILELQPLAEAELREIMGRALRFLLAQTGAAPQFSPAAEAMLLHYANGDARRLLNLVEIICQSENAAASIDEKLLADIMQNRVYAYDRSGDERYQLISAFHKSVRNSDVDSTLFWLYRMLEGGEDPLYILRRMVRITVEDIGLADPQALQICLQAKQGYEFLGSPEGDLLLAEVAVYLASAPKSNALYRSESRLKEIAAKYRQAPVPLHLINPSNFIAVGKGAGQDYFYAHDFSEKTSTMSTMPPEVSEREFYQPNALGFEKIIGKRMEYWKKVKENMTKENKTDEENR